MADKKPSEHEVANMDAILKNIRERLFRIKAKHIEVTMNELPTARPWYLLVSHVDEAISSIEKAIKETEKLK